jgi:hypothetical protein
VFVVIAFEGRCLHVVTRPTGETLLRVDDCLPSDDAVFERIDLAHGRIALRVADGRYLARHRVHPLDQAHHGAGGRASLHLLDEITPCAAFEERPLPGGAVSLRGCDMRYLGVRTSGAVVADRVADGSWERFRYLEVPVPDTSVPQQISPPAEPVTFAVH